MEKNNKRIILIFVLLFLIGGLSFCTPNIQTTPREQAYLQRALRTPLQFKVEKEKDDIVWGRINSWISRFSSMKVQVANDYMIQTYNPVGFLIPKFGYTASRIPMGDKTGFEIRCSYSGQFSENTANQNAHILAHYALTGEVIPKLIFK